MLAALAAALVLGSPPAPALVDMAARLPDAVLDLRYATPHNFLGHRLYPEDARCLLLPAVAERLARAAARLRREGLRLRLWDCYRPLAVQRAMWERVPHRGWVADPARGSNHNRAAAVDVGLVSLAGGAVPVPTDFDTFSADAYARSPGPPAAARRNRDRLRAAMEAEGFRVNGMEWWHFDAPEAHGAPVLDVPLSPGGAAR